MRIIALVAIYGAATIVASAGIAQVLPPPTAVPELGYKVSSEFFQFPPNWIEGEAAGVAVNSKGHIFLFQRTKPMLSEFDEKGVYVRSLGEGLFDHPHGLRIDSDDNLWTTDDTNSTVLKLSPAGKVMMVLGRRNNSGEANWLFNKPTDVAFSKNGDVFVTDGYGNSRVVKFDHNGNFLKSWGRFGSGEGEFMLPHSVVIDKSDRVYIGDRENARIQIFDTEGRFLSQWTGIGYPYGLWMAPNQHVWMVDGGFDRIVEMDQTGKILGAIGSPGHLPGQLAWGHFLAFGSDGKLFVADVLNWRFQVFIPIKASGKLSDYVPTERKFFGFKPSDGYFFRSPGWPTK
jgi:DNA-binding beta-propeller fold protein YncE